MVFVLTHTCTVDICECKKNSIFIGEDPRECPRIRESLGLLDTRVEREAENSRIVCALYMIQSCHSYGCSSLGIASIKALQNDFPLLQVEPNVRVWSDKKSTHLKSCARVTKLGCRRVGVEMAPN